VAAVGIPAVLGLIHVGGWPLGLLVAGAAGVASWEFYGLAGVQGIHPFRVLGTVASVAVVLIATAHPAPERAALPLAGVVLALALLSLGSSVVLRWPGGAPLADVGATLLGVLYVGCTLSFIPFLRALPESAAAGAELASFTASAFVILPLATTWAGDSAAYFGGSLWGRHRLAPSVSPKKSVEGAIAGLAASAGAAALVSWWALAALPGLSVAPLTATWMGAVLGAAAQVGDLAESVLKREAGVKDSGRLLLGHGGFLDRLDALFFALPAAWGLLLVVGGTT
jgi:phosphatidate cytidylyltransferase